MPLDALLNSTRGEFFQPRRPLSGSMKGYQNPLMRSRFLSQFSVIKMRRSPSSRVIQPRSTPITIAAK